jgi:hexosaminidase
MPWPLEINENGHEFKINNDFTIVIENTKNKRINKATKRFINRLASSTGTFITKNSALVNDTTVKNSVLIIQYDSIGELKLHEDESYKLEVLENKIYLNASTDIGILRGLETLLQLITNKKKYYIFAGVNIYDSPRFPWRGLMIDVSRHFEPLAILKRNLDAMASVKLNVFHWHLTDDQGFRVEVKSYPKFHKLASDGLYYTQKEIKELVKYATNLGIRVVPEFDVPAHATSWLVAYPEIGSQENTSYTIEKNAGIFNPTLDPTNDTTYKIIEAVFSEMATLFSDDYFHIGGDENAGKHWNNNKKIQSFMKDENLKNNHELQTYFNIRIQNILSKNNKIMMGWDEIFQPNLPKDVVIHSWRGKKALIKAAKQGYQTVLSQGYYIDLMHPASTHYLNDPLDKNNNLTPNERKNILGGEATMWGELVTPLTIDSRIWPRTAAIAERLWSKQSIIDVDNMYKRLEKISFQLESLGLTHIKNKDIILRNITDNQDITALKDLMNICEPVKGYTRNKNGTEYKTFSPFTLFADACTADAPDAIRFNRFTNLFLKNHHKESLIFLKKYLNKWSKNYFKLQQIKRNPKTKSLITLSKNLSELSTNLLQVINQKKVSDKQLNEMQTMLNNLKKPYVDVELVVINSLENILISLEKQYLTKI